MNFPSYVPKKALKSISSDIMILAFILHVTALKGVSVISPTSSVCVCVYRWGGHVGIGGYVSVPD